MPNSTETLTELLHEDMTQVSTDSYTGLHFDLIPANLQTRVFAAAQLAREDGRYELTFNEVTLSDGSPPLWRFGEHADVFVFNGPTLHETFHRVGNRHFHMSIAGTTQPFYRNRIAHVLGFNKEQARELEGFGTKRDRLAEQMDYYYTNPTSRPSGPFYGMTVQTAAA